MRVCAKGEYEKKGLDTVFHVTSMIPVNDLDVEVHPLDVVGFGEHKFFARPCQCGNDFRLTFIELSKGQDELPVDVLYEIYKKSHGRYLHPGVGLWALDEFSAESGMWHNKVPQCDDFLDVVLVALGLPPKTRKLYDYINLVNRAGDVDDEGDGIVKFHFMTDGTILGIPVTESFKHGIVEYDSGRKRVRAASYLVNWHTRVDGTQNLSRVVLTDQADPDTIGRKIAEIFQLPDLSELAKLCIRRPKPQKKAGLQKVLSDEAAAELLKKTVVPPSNGVTSNDITDLNGHIRELDDKLDAAAKRENALKDQVDLAKREAEAEKARVKALQEDNGVETADNA